MVREREREREIELINKFMVQKCYLTILIKPYANLKPSKNYDAYH